VLAPASLLLGLLAVASIAVVAGGRMAEQDKRMGLLKAVGGTPPLAAAVLLAEHVVVALAAAAVGLTAGRLAAPLLTGPGASLVGSPGAPAFTVSTVLIVAGLSATQLLPALAGALLGIPAGTELYAAVQGAGPRGTPPAWWLLAMVLGMLLAAAGLTAIPARAGVRRPTAEILQAETA